MKRLLLLGFTLFFLGHVYAQDTAYQTWYLQREDLDILVKELGAGHDTVIVVHGGFGANHAYMLDAIRGLEAEFHFVFYDQRGSLLSPTKKENLTFEKNVDDLYALIKALKLSRANLFCHSMGTLVGMEFTKQHPELVNHLVLAGTILPKSDSLQSIFSERYRDQLDFLSKRQEVADLIQPFKDKGVDRLTSIEDIEHSALTHKDLTDYWRVNYAAVNIWDMRKYNLVKGGRAYYKQAASVMAETVNWNFDYRRVLNERAKTTIINGEYDFFDFRGETLSALLHGYDQIELTCIPNAGHLSWIDQPAQFKRALWAALKRY